MEMKSTRRALFIRDFPRHLHRHEPLIRSPRVDDDYPNLPNRYCFQIQALDNF